MRMAGTWRIPAVIAIALILAPAASRAQLVETSIQPAAEGNWSATAGRTSGAGNSVLQVEAGWPGIGVTWLKGLDERSVLGFHVAFNYGVEGTSTSGTRVNPAIPHPRALARKGGTTLAF